MCLQHFMTLIPFSVDGGRLCHIPNICHHRSESEKIKLTSCSQFTIQFDRYIYITSFLKRGCPT